MLSSFLLFHLHVSGGLSCNMYAGRPLLLLNCHRLTTGVATSLAGETSILGCRAHCHLSSDTFNCSPKPRLWGPFPHFTISSFDAILITYSRLATARSEMRSELLFERSMNRSTRCRLDQRIAGDLGFAVLYSWDRQIIIFEGLWFLT
jgi:hypothetical protein